MKKSTRNALDYDWRARGYVRQREVLAALRMRLAAFEAGSVEIEPVAVAEIKTSIAGLETKLKERKRDMTSRVQKMAG